VLVLGSAVTLGIVFRNTAQPEKETLRNDPIQVYKEPVPVKLSKTDRALALDTALKFVNTAVARRHVEDSYALASPGLREGLTRSQWSRGEIPVIPYPATEARVRVDYSFRNELGLTLLLVPSSVSKLNPMAFNMDLTARGTGNERRWLVNSWTPSGAPAAATVDGGGGGGGVLGGTNLAPQNTEGLDSPIGAGWIIAPIALLGAVLLVPIVVGIRSWRENRKAMRDYEAMRSLDL
jgi:hypothetical protein